MIFHCMYIPHFVYPFTHRWTPELLPSFGYCEYCCSEYGCRGIWLPVFNFGGGYISRSKIAGSYGNSMLNFFRNLHTVFHPSVPPTGHKRSNFSTSSPMLAIFWGFLVCLFLMVAILRGVRWYYQCFNKINIYGGISGSPVVKTPCFQCRGHR